MKDELRFLKDMLASTEVTQPSARLYHNNLESQINTIMRTIDRYEKGVDFHVRIKDGDTSWHRTQTTRRTEKSNRDLENKYPEVAAAGEAYRDAIDQAKIMDKLADE